ncbi:CHC2 zinc finger domain-containing protein [Desulfosarcina ovata]|uniref:Zinc finger CHC2-type domain-containing protein n=1 Tax=Desulfosarcina ovata subsp. ovata TaxID=2752305 RepID=A0A5K8AK45_9BACT|nr:CHC2 zinc finger domain-containing protein [Desulfosarcina ovata]BBO93093.1 hypothetical protein DSCOOX_62730 [Desulfosarcina ovata subsp. ovata]
MISLETTDIFRGAFFLASGGDLAGIRVGRHGKRIATFLITGHGLDRLDRDYRSGRARVNPIQLRESLNHLRDAMFEKCARARGERDMAIAKEKIEAIKHGVDLMALARSRGIELKKNGKSFLGLCPFHDDTNPSLSINPDENLFQCFGCGAAGDVIRFVELFDKVVFPEAVNRLSDSDVKSSKARKAASGKKALSVKDRKLLSRVVGYYQHKKTGVGPSWIPNWRGSRSKTGSFYGLKSMFLGPERAFCWFGDAQANQLK